MSREFWVQSATGVVVRKEPDGIFFIIQATTPTNGQAGYGRGCHWINTAGGVGTIFYINVGSITSTTWVNLA